MAWVTWVQAALWTIIWVLPETESFQVIGAGWCRTGTSSLAVALRTLGYKVYHGGAVSGGLGVEHSSRWVSVVRRNSPRLLYDLASDMVSRMRFDATVDDPFSGFTLELLKRFPDAKVILTTHKNPEAWFRSVKLNGKRCRLYTLPPYRDHFKHVVDMYKAYYRRRNCSVYPTDADQERCIATYEKHNAAIRRLVPPHQLLDFQVRQGWEPLCKFLNKPIPSTPFPRANNSRDYLRAQVGSKSQQGIIVTISMCESYQNMISHCANDLMINI